MTLRVVAMLTLLAGCPEPPTPAVPSSEPSEQPTDPEPGSTPDPDTPDPTPSLVGELRQVALLKAPLGAEGDNFGLSVSLAANGRTLAVGALREDGASSGIDNDPTARGLTDSGAVYIFRRLDGDWVPEAYIKASLPAEGDQFGFSTALSADGTTLAVGAIREDGSSTGVNADERAKGVPDSGAVYVFHRTDQGWAQQAYLKADHLAPEDYFGWSIALSARGDLLAVGAMLEDSGGRGVDATPGDSEAADSGAVYLYRRRGGQWHRESYLKASNADPGDRFGMSLALSDDGTTLAVGAGGEASRSAATPNDDSAPGAGAAYVFELQDQAWHEVAYIKAFNAQAGVQFGTSIALDGPGRTLAVGAIGEPSGPPEAPPGTRLVNAGAVYVYRSVGWPGRQAWFLKPPHVFMNTNYGRSVALDGSGQLLTVGASWEHSDARGLDGDGSNQRAGFAGAAWLLEGGGPWSVAHYIKASNTAPHQNFGVNVSMSASGRVIAIGASGESSPTGEPDEDPAPKSGAVYVFER